MSVTGFHPAPPLRPLSTLAEGLKRTAPGQPATRCGFCRRRQHEVAFLVQRGTCFICDLCVDEAAAMIAAARAGR